MNGKLPIDRPTIASAKKRQGKVKKERLMGSASVKSRKTRNSKHGTEDTDESSTASSVNCRQRTNQALDRTRKFVEPLLEAPVSNRSRKHDNRTRSDETADTSPQMTNLHHSKNAKLSSQKQGQHEQNQNLKTESDDEQQQQEKQQQQTLIQKKSDKQQEDQQQEQKHVQQQQQEQQQQNPQPPQKANNQQPQQQQQQDKQEQNQQPHKGQKQQKQQQQQQQQSPKVKKKQQVPVPMTGARLFTDNLEFYQNKIKSKPFPGNTINDMLKWKGDYGMLERNHRYIQWLFPIPEGNGLNASAQALMDNEAQEMKNDKKIQKRILDAFKMMLDFYGMELKDTNHGVFKRTSKWKERYEHLNRSRHNFMRITRILKSLGELGYERLQAPWVMFLLSEAQTAEELWALNGPCMEHWIGAVKDPVEQAVLLEKRHKWSATQTGSRNYEMTELSESEDEDVDVEVVGKGDDEEDEENNNDNSCQNKVLAVSVESDEESAGKEVSAASKRKKNDEDTHRHSATDELKAKRLKQEENAKVENPDCHNGAEQQWPNQNLKFYRNEILSSPSPGYTIETMLKHKGDHAFYDEYPSFSQWLFPSKNPSSQNPECQELNDHEAKEIREDTVLSGRVLEAYKTVLDYFGMELVDNIQGKVKRNTATYNLRYKYICSCPGNYMRITRILSSLGELGYERFQVPFIDFLVTEGVDNDMFHTLQEEAVEHWTNAIKDEGEKYALFLKYKTLFKDKQRYEDIGDRLADLQLNEIACRKCEKEIRRLLAQSEQPRTQRILPTKREYHSDKAFIKENVSKENALGPMQLSSHAQDNIDF